MTSVAIIGLGSVGSALARGWAGKGPTLLLGSRDPSGPKAQALADAVGGRSLLPADAAGEADVVVLALPWAAAEAVARGLGDLAGRIVIDCMNPIGRVDGGMGLLVGHSTSGAETVATWLPGARLVKTLNQVGAEVMADNAHMAHRPAMFMAGDHAEAKAVVGSLLTLLGFDPLDAGDLCKARLLEPLAMVWINQALMQGKGRGWALAVVDQANAAAAS